MSGEVGGWRKRANSLTCRGRGGRGRVDGRGLRWHRGRSRGRGSGGPVLRWMSLVGGWCGRKEGEKEEATRTARAAQRGLWMNEWINGWVEERRKRDLCVCGCGGWMGGWEEEGRKRRAQGN